MPVLGRRPDVAHVAYPGERHFQRPGDRGGGECEDIHADSELFDGVLGVHPESLLVDHEQAQVLPVDVIAEHSVRTDDHIHVARRMPSTTVFC